MAQEAPGAEAWPGGPRRASEGAQAGGPGQRSRVGKSGKVVKGRGSRLGSLGSRLGQDVLEGSGGRGTRRGRCWCRVGAG